MAEFLWRKLVTDKPIVFNQWESQPNTDSTRIRKLVMRLRGTKRQSRRTLPDASLGPTPRDLPQAMNVARNHHDSRSGLGG